MNVSNHVEVCLPFLHVGYIFHNETKKTDILSPILLFSLSRRIESNACFQSLTINLSARSCVSRM